ncbi:hypothetical protein M413DRAFT_388390 [Hebeloma cylindrosporum]|uniref:Uncharacterized protein n=1 Tax=Hebeloma cylindrosporum TaxID=76867 RepID=A0A0C2YRW2_HEBCY|nr:hypothetical protein M413DRAFT_388390 [Hebeloma cylindrosporum h7]
MHVAVFTSSVLSACFFLLFGQAISFLFSQLLLYFHPQENIYYSRAQAQCPYSRPWAYPAHICSGLC